MDLPPEAGKALPGVLGAASAVALTLLQETRHGGVLLGWREKLFRGLVMGPPSAALSWYGGAHLALQSGLPEGLAGFLLGLTGMALIAKVLDTWQRFDLGSRLGRFVDKVLGLPPDERQP